MRCKVGEGELENVSVLRTYRMDGHLRDFDGFKRFVKFVISLAIVILHKVISAENGTTFSIEYIARIYQQLMNSDDLYTVRNTLMSYLYLDEYLFHLQSVVHTVLCVLHRYYFIQAVDVLRDSTEIFARKWLKKLL